MHDCEIVELVSVRRLTPGEKRNPKVKQKTQILTEYDSPGGGYGGRAGRNPSPRI